MVSISKIVFFGFDIKNKREKNYRNWFLPFFFISKQKWAKNLNFDIPNVYTHVLEGKKQGKEKMNTKKGNYKKLILKCTRTFFYIF